MVRRYTLFLCCLLVICAAAKASAANVVIPFPELGYGSDVSIVGPNPKFSLYVPVYPQLRSLHVRIPLAVSPLIDRRSTLTLSVNDRPVFTTTVGALGKDPVIDRTIGLPAGAPAAMNIALSGAFFRPGDVCFDLDVSDFWMNVLHTGSLTAITGPVHHKPFIRDFLREYDGRITVVMPADMRTGDRYSMLRLAYSLHQTNRWRHTALALRPTRDSGSRNIIFGTFRAAIEARGNDLYVNAQGLAALAHQLDELFITDTVRTATYSAPATGEVHERTFDDLGIGTQTQSGIGELPFLLPLGLSQIGGTPTNLRLHIALTHTSLAAEDRGFVKVLMNNTLIRSFEFARAGGQEDFDVPLADDELRATNDLRIVPSYYNKRAACKGSYPKMTVSLLNASKFSWDDLSKQTPSVGDFYNMASGRVVALVADPSLIPYAFAVLDSLGAVNSSIKQLDVQAYDGTVPPGYDYSMIVAPPEKIVHLALPMQFDGKQFSLSRTGPGDATAQYHAQYSQPFGVLETGKDSSTLVATYWKDPSAGSGLERIAPTQLAEQTDDVFIFNQETATYSSTTQKTRVIQKGDAVRRAMIPLLGAFLLALLVLVVLTARRARHVS